MKFFKRSFFILSFLLSAGVAFAYTSPGKPVGHVNDYTGTLNEETKTRLEAFLYDLKNAGKGEVAIVVIPTLGGDAIEDYANTLGREWGIGNKESNNGVLFVVAKDDRELRIEVGYGLEGDLTDLKSHRIIDEVVVPRFKEGDYNKGIEDGVREIVGVIAPGFMGSTQSVDYSKDPTSSTGNFTPIIFFLVVFAWAILASTKSWWQGGILGGVVGVVVVFITGLFSWTLAIIACAVLLGLITDFIASKVGIVTGNGPLNGGGFSSGGSSRGFGGFGGGSFGGGGSSGRW